MACYALGISQGGGRAPLGSWLGCLNSVSLDGARNGIKARRQASKVPLSSADQNLNCGDPTFNSLGLETLGKDLPASHLGFSW